jgi:hypothetical protein
MGRVRHPALPWVVSAAVVAALMAPMLLTHRSFGVDWGGHLWLVRAQTQNVVDIGHPGYFVQSGLGAFYPWFAFYGGTLYGSVAAVAAVLGRHHVTGVYVASFAVAMALAWVGMTWLARQAGLRGWAAQVPGLAFVTSSYYLTDVYARGAWPETVAISALPLLLAAALSTIRAERPRAGPAAALVIAAAIVAGSHSITLVWGAVFVVGVAAVSLVAAGSEQRRARVRRLGLAGGLALLGAGVNLWFLLIAIRLRNQVPVETHVQPRTAELTPGVLLSPWRFSPFSDNPTFDLQAPTLLLLWTGLALWLAPLRGRVRRRMAAGLALLLIPLGLLLAVQSTWALVPHGLWLIQFPYRLQTYVVLCAAGLVILALTGLARASGARRTLLVGSLGAILALETGQAVAQAWRTPSYLDDRREVVARPPTKPPRWWEVFAVRNEFADVGARVVRPTLTSIPGATAPGGPPAVTYTGAAAQTLSLPVTELPLRSRYELHFRTPQPGSVVTNVIGSPRLVAVSGGTAVGRLDDSRMVVQLPRSGDTRLAFSPARTRGIVAGWIASIVCALAALVLLAGLWLRGRRSRRA